PGAVGQPIRISEIVYPQATLVAPADRVNVNAKVLTLRCETGDAVAKRCGNMVRSTVRFGYLGVWPEVPTELRRHSGTGGLGSIAVALQSRPPQRSRSTQVG